MAGTEHPKEPAETEADPADVADQHSTLVPDEEEEQLEPSGRDWEVPEADRIEQAREVVTTEDEEWPEEPPT